MAININPNRINSGGAGKAGPRRERTGESVDSIPVIIPRRADVNHIPSAESLQTLISSAVEALRRGIRWDRGTILNLLA